MSPLRRHRSGSPSRRLQLRSTCEPIDARPKPPHLRHEQTRHGVWVWYVRRGHGSRIRLRAEYHSPEFWEEYRAALAGAPKVKVAPLIL
jgi:hypothetical protein